MQPVKDSFTVFQGSYQTRRYQWKQGAVVVDLTGATARLQFRKGVKGDVIYEMTTENGLIEISGDNWIKLKFTGVSTSAIDTTDKIKVTGHLEVVRSDGEPYRIVEIELLIDPEITR